MNSGVVVFCFPSSFVVFLQFFLCSAILPVRFIIKWKGGVAVYRIVSPINNNIALVKDESQRELILTGKGIVFQKKKGDIIASSLVDKVFRLNTEESKENFLALLKDVPLDFITVTYDVIDTLTLKYNYPVQDYLYVTLTDHIYCTYQSIQTGNYQSSKLPDVSREYPIEYKIGAEALSIFKSKLLDRFPDEELGRIAIHFINARRDGEVAPSVEISRTKHILDLVKQELARNHIERTSLNSNFYDRFMVHLSYFLDYIDRSRKDNTSLLGMEEHLKISYPEAFEIGNRIYDVIARETGVDLFHSERIYIVLHIQRLL